MKLLIIYTLVDFRYR